MLKNHHKAGNEVTDAQNLLREDSQCMCPPQYSNETYANVQDPLTPLTVNFTIQFLHLQLNEICTFLSLNMLVDVFCSERAGLAVPFLSDLYTKLSFTSF